MHKGAVLKGVFETAYRRQTRREAGGVSMHDMRASLLLSQLLDDAYIYLPQVPGGGRPQGVFLVTTRTVAQLAAEFI
ncbi:unnamed protein product [Pieris brassicae]|uniref:Uncharacterized protein n=1 Tax=Pieris brassicae TaxID=7116 RepID=A0A9P0TBD1_PIEBR|nr:unnamed protein product [Pieris brassicae]